MMYTPNKDNYVQELRLPAGMNQEVKDVYFELKYLVKYELFKNVVNYYPIIMSVNYIKNNKPYAFVNYGIFKKNAKNEIHGIKIIK